MNQKTRPDFTNALVHFTKPRKGNVRHWEFDYQSVNNSSKQFSSFEVLKEIFESGTLKGSTSSSGYIKGKKRAVCLSEVPLGGIRYFCDKESKYDFYGVSISKQSGFNQGARPVIYLPDEENGWVPEDERWRVVRHEPPHVDVSWEREWRVSEDLDLGEVVGCYFFVWKPEEKKELEQLEFPHNTLRGILCMEHLLNMV